MLTDGYQDDVIAVLIDDDHAFHRADTDIRSDRVLQKVIGSLWLPNFSPVLVVLLRVICHSFSAGADKGVISQPKLRSSGFGKFIIPHGKPKRTQCP